MGWNLQSMTGRIGLGIASVMLGCTGATGPAGPTGIGSSTPGEGLMSLRALASDGTFSAPLDAVLTADGKTVFFSAWNANDEASIFRADASGAAQVVAVASLASAVLPVSLALASDERTLYLADLGVGTAGALCAVDLSSGGITALAADDSSGQLAPTAIALSADGNSSSSCSRPTRSRASTRTARPRRVRIRRHPGTWARARFRRPED